jgi:hypothetical protein
VSILIRTWRAHPLATAAAAAFTFRIAIFLFALVWPIAGEDSRLVSPRLFEQVSSSSRKVPAFLQPF